MDLVTRLKEYIAKTSIPVTQFADMCGIARPTLSQLLNGRNKKVSDEIIAKIHSAFPSLSVYWLMFGEGGMETGENIEISGGKNGSEMPVEDASLFGNQDDDEIFDVSTTSREIDKSGIIEFFDQAKTQQRGVGEAPQQSSGNSFVRKDADTAKDGVQDRRGEAVSIKVNQGADKLITNIVVFYSDNSFQSFRPV